MSNCIKCHAPLPADALYCHRCGKKQSVTKRKRNKRPNGFGSVYKEGATWTAVVTKGYTPSAAPDTPKRRKTAKKRGFQTEREALEYLSVLKEQAEKQRHITFAQLYDLWLPTHRAGKDTMNCYKAAYKHFADVHTLYLDEISIEDLQECLDECPRGKATRHNMKTLGGLLYDYAIPRRYTDLNLANYLTVTGESGEARIGFNAAQLEMIRRAIGKVPYADYIYCLCYLGYRPTEFVGLDIEHYNAKEGYFVGGIKTEAGIDRIVTISPKIRPLIDKFVGSRTTGPILHDGQGNSIPYAKWREDCFYPALEAIGIDNPIREDGRHLYTPHCCRHTFATLMKRVEAPDKDKLAIIGHSSTKMLRYYQDVDLEDLRRITDAL